MQSNRSKTLSLFLLFAPLLVLWRPISLGETFYYQDIGAQYLPREALLLHQGASGWNSHMFLGLPLLGDPQTAPFEPVRALCRAVGLAPLHGLLVYVAFYLLIAAAGCYAFALARRASPLGALLAANVFVFGALLLRIRHPWIFLGYSLSPWLALACDRLLERRRFADAAVIAVLIAWAALGGHPQAFFMAWLFAIGYVALGSVRGTRLMLALRLAGASILSVGMLAIYYAPVAAVAQASARQAAGLAFAGSYSWNPWDWVRLLSPDIYGNDIAGTHFGTRNYHEQTIYLGIAPLLLATISWRADRHLARVGALAFVLAAGRFLPLFYVAYYLVPGFKLFRAPCRYALYFMLAGAVLAGLGLGRIERDERPADPDRTARRLRWFWITASVVFAIAAIGVGPWIDRYTEPGAHATMRWAAVRTVLALASTGWVLDRWLSARTSGRPTALALVGITALDFALQWGGYRQTLPPADVFPAPAVLQALAGAAPGRILVHDYKPDGEPHIGPLLNGGEAAGYDDLRGYNQLISTDLIALLRKGDRFTGSRNEYYAIAPCDPDDWLLDLLSVRLIVGRDLPARWQKLPVIATGGGLEVRERASTPPPVWLVGAAEVIPNPAALERLPTLDARRIAVVERDVGLPQTSGAVGEATIAESGAEDVVVQADATQPALVVLADQFDPDWTARVDGVAQPIVRADFLLRGVRIDAGRHRIAFHYETRGRRLGVLVTAITIPFVVLTLFLGLRQRQRYRV